MLSRIRPTLLNGRVRTSTVLLSVLFVGVLALYLLVRPVPETGPSSRAASPEREDKKSRTTSTSPASPTETNPTETNPSETTPTETSPTKTAPSKTTPTETTPGKTTPGKTTTTPDAKRPDTSPPTPPDRPSNENEPRPAPEPGTTTSP